MIESFSEWFHRKKRHPKTGDQTKNTFCLEVLALAFTLPKGWLWPFDCNRLKLKLFFSPRACKPHQEELSKPSGGDLWKIPRTQVLEEATSLYGMANIQKKTLKIFLSTKYTNKNMLNQEQSNWFSTKHYWLQWHCAFTQQHNLISLCSDANSFLVLASLRCLLRMGGSLLMLMLAKLMIAICFQTNSSILPSKSIVQNRRDVKSKKVAHAPQQSVEVLVKSTTHLSFTNVRSQSCYL